MPVPEDVIVTAARFRRRVENVIQMEPLATVEQKVMVAVVEKAKEIEQLLLDIRRAA
jgi:hypothetical protein